MTAIVVISNCQVRDLVEALGYIVPGASVSGFFNADLPKQAEEALRAVEKADVVVSLPFDESFGPFSAESIRATAKQVVLVPPVNFAGFHPDITYLFDDLGRTVQSPLGAYHSTIVLGAFLAGVRRERIPRLFNSLLYSRLGYFDAYESGRRELLEEFQRWGFEMADLFRGWERRGVFMYTVNHPKAFVLVDVAREACRKLGIPVGDAVPYQDFFCDAGSINGVYPVFPELGYRIGLPGHYLFRPASSFEGGRERVLYGLDNFVQRSLELYEPADTSSWVLSERLRRSVEVISAFA